MPSCSLLIFPNDEPLATFMLGNPQLLMLNRLANCASYFRENRSVRRNDLPKDVEKVTVLGPSRMPTPQFPNLPMSLAGTADDS